MKVVYIYSFFLISHFFFFSNREGNRDRLIKKGRKKKKTSARKGMLWLAYFCLGTNSTQKYTSNAKHCQMLRTSFPLEIKHIIEISGSGDTNKHIKKYFL